MPESGPWGHPAQQPAACAQLQKQWTQLPTLMLVKGFNITSIPRASPQPFTSPSLEMRARNNSAHQKPLRKTGWGVTRQETPGGEHS